jgi:hypothetical protein
MPSFNPTYEILLQGRGMDFPSVDDPSKACREEREREREWACRGEWERARGREREAVSLAKSYDVMINVILILLTSLRPGQQ